MHQLCVLTAKSTFAAGIYMIRHWSIGGFKSFKNNTAMELAPITVFAGSNSSGKSTIIQSILMLKQTVQYGSNSRVLALNGPLVRLGTFDDVIHYGADPRAITIELEYDLNEFTETPVRDLPRWFRPGSFSAGRLDNIAGKFTWQPRIQTSGEAEGPNKLQATVTRGEFRVKLSPTKDTETSVEQSVSFIPTSFESYWNGEESQLRWADLDLDYISLRELLKNSPDGHVDHMALNFFLPGLIRFSFNKGKKKVFDMMEALFAGSFTILTGASLEGEMLPVSVARLVNAWLVQHDRPPLAFDEEQGIAATVLREELSKHRRKIGTILGHMGVKSVEGIDQLRLDLEAELLRVYETKETDFDYGSVRNLDDGASVLIAFLKTGVQYLGPLRNEPKPVYPLEALENTATVGYRGEHTAAVLFLNAEQTVEYLPPAVVETSSSSKSLKKGTLRSAVNEWLEYLGVATGVFAAEAGVFGNTVQVTTEGLTKQHDLTNVGVGVSQVLPIVVSCLLAQKGSLLMFEQPELHLHPKVQARLADFFYAVGLSGKQCLLETHSEYMIDRFRRRIAEEENESLQKMLKIYFTERFDGETHCREVSISKFGAVIDWPKDFFEQSQTETRRILDAASKKRLREKKIH
jgi:predicted ATPase